VSRRRRSPAFQGSASACPATGLPVAILSNNIGNVFDVAQAFDGTEVRLYTLFLRQVLFDLRRARDAP